MFEVIRKTDGYLPNLEPLMYTQEYVYITLFRWQVLSKFREEQGSPAHLIGAFPFNLD